MLDLVDGGIDPEFLLKILLFIDGILGNLDSLAFVVTLDLDGGCLFLALFGDVDI